MIKDIHEVKECPDCAGTALVYVKSRDQVICKDCGLVYEPLTPESEKVFEVTHAIETKEREISAPIETIIAPAPVARAKKKPKKKPVKKKPIKKRPARKPAKKKPVRKAVKKKPKRKVVKRKPAKRKVVKKKPIRKPAKKARKPTKKKSVKKSAKKRFGSFFKRFRK